MSVLVKGMEMPKSCNHCSFSSWSNLYQTMRCNRCIKLCFKKGSEEYMIKRPEWCPLVEVSAPHGRLIDADALDKRIRQAGGTADAEVNCTEDFNDGILFVLDYFVKSMQTVIEAEVTE